MYDAIILGISQVRSRFNQPTVWPKRLLGSDDSTLLAKSSRNNAVIDLLPHYMIFVNWAGEQQPTCDRNLSSVRCRKDFLWHWWHRVLFNSSNCCVLETTWRLWKKMTTTWLRTKKSAIIHIFSSKYMLEPQERDIRRTRSYYEQLHWHQLGRINGW